MSDGPSVKKTRKTAAVKWGLHVLWCFAAADIEASDADQPPRWSKKDREKIARALQWLKEQAE